MTDLNEKIVLITGAGGGFGQHMTQQFRDAGCKLVLTDINEKALRPAVDGSSDSLLAAVTADLATEEGCGVIAGTCTASDIQPDILVNNAGIGFGGRLDNVPREKWESLMQLNLLAPMRLCNLFLPQMIERGSGHIVNISSLAGWIGSPGLSVYCASKFGLRGFGEALSVDLDGTGVQVSNVYPCFSRTPILDSPQYGYEERRAVPENLISEPSDVVARIISGIRKDTLHIFPDKHSRRIHYMKRYAPWLISLVNRRMQNDSVKAASEAN
jgi:short-subunit dehydrogenase